MIEFYPVLIKNTGEIFHNIFATTHNDLIGKYITHEDNENKTYFKAVFSPKGRLDDVNEYHLIYSENYIPDWFYGDFKEQVISKLKQIIDSMIIRGRKKLLLHEGAILTKNACIDELKHSIIFAMYDKAKVKSVSNNSEILLLTDNCVVDGLFDNSRITDVQGFARINVLNDYSKIINLGGHATVGKLYNHSRIVSVKYDANIEEMHESSKAHRLKNMAKITEMHGHSVIEEMLDFSVVEKMFDSSRINYMDSESKVLEMFGNSMVEYMSGNSVVEKLYENSLVRKISDMAKILEKELKN